METTAELYNYILRWHSELMTEPESLALRHLQATMKAAEGRSDLAAQNEARASKIFSRNLSGDEKVLTLAMDGYEAFVKHTARRILSENAKLKLNRCPRCAGLARTPTAKQCRFCDNDWHEKNE